jgi:hypothetical protein
MTAIAVLFAVVLVGAVPLTLARTGAVAGANVPFAASPGRWPAAVALAVAMLAAPGPVAVALAIPWQVLTGLAALTAVIGLARDRSAWRPSPRLAVTVALGFLAFGAANATSFAAGFAPLGFAPTIVLLTAVHFHTAGFILTIAGTLAFVRRPSSVAGGGVSAVAVGSVVTAAGFVGVPIAAQAGAVTVAIGGLLIAWATILVARDLRPTSARALTTIAGGALVVSMPLAIVWALAPAVGLVLDLDLMVRTHGAINALVVAVPLSVGWALDARGDGR